MRNEPLVENTQIKGTSDTHPFLSPNDEWADFEIFPYRIASWLRSRPRGSYTRAAWRNGLAMEATDGVNPYRFGVVGASDTHNSGDVFDEDRYVSKLGAIDGDDGVGRGSVPVSGEGEPPSYRQTAGIYFSAAGMAAVWAERNDREAIFNAFRRKETYSTTGTRIRLRFFAGYGLSDDMLDADAVATAYQRGAPMGGELVAKADAAPDFLVWAAQDPQKSRLQRVQIVKGWTETGTSGVESQERVYDVACSDGLAVDPATHRCPDNGATVNVEDCSVTEDVGARTLSAVWQDPDFDPAQRAFYYVRVLENPVCRWSTWDAIRAGRDPRPNVSATIQERAYSSPIWIRPG